MKRLIIILSITFLAVSLPALAMAEKKAARRTQTPQVLRAIYPVEPLSLDPHGPLDAAAAPIIMAAYDRLMTFKPGTAEPSPALARIVQVSPDGLIYTFYLHEGLTFADGTAVTSEAAFFSFERLMQTETGRRFFPYLKQFKMDGTYGFRLILSRPWPPFLASLALPQASLVSPSLKGRPSNYLNTRTLGSGPFQVYDWKSNTIGLRLRRDLPPRADHSVYFAMFHYEPDAQKRYEKMLAHEAHLTIDPALPEKGAALPPEHRLLQVPTFETHFLAFNTKKPYTGGQHIRRAISFLVADIFKGRQGRMTEPFPDGLFYNSPSRAEAPILGDGDKVSQGKNILREAGPPPGPLVLAYQGGNKPVADDAHLIARTLEAYGFQITTRTYDSKQEGQLLAKGEYDLYLAARAPEIPAADMWLSRFLESGSPPQYNPAFFQNARADQLIKEIADTVGKAGDGPNDLRRVVSERASKLAALAEIAVTEVPYLFLYQAERPLIIDARLTDLIPHPVWPEVWPLDQSKLPPYSHRSGANPSGKPQTAAKAPAPQTPKVDNSPAPAAPQKPAQPVKPAVPAPAPPAAPARTQAAGQNREEPAQSPKQSPPEPDLHEELDYDDFYGPDDLLPTTSGGLL